MRSLSTMAATKDRLARPMDHLAIFAREGLSTQAVKDLAEAMHASASVVEEGKEGEASP